MQVLLNPRMKAVRRLSPDPSYPQLSSASTLLYNYTPLNPRLRAVLVREVYQPN